MMFETHDAAFIRVVIPMRLAFRGGRTWIVDPDGQSMRRLKRQDGTLAAGLKAGHAILSVAGLSPSAPGLAHEAKAPASAYDRKRCQLALLAPDVQRMILESSQPAGLDLTTLLAADAPLAWADQKASLEGLSSAR